MTYYRGVLDFPKIKELRLHSFDTLINSVRCVVFFCKEELRNKYIHYEIYYPGRKVSGVLIIVSK